MVSDRLKSLEHQVDHGDVYPRFAAFRALLIVLAQSSATAKPRRHSLHHPPLGQNLEVVAVRFALHHGEQPSPRWPKPTTPVCQHRSPWGPLFRGLHRLTVDDGRAGDSLSPHRAPGWQVMGQHLPGNAAARTYRMPLTTSRKSVVRGWPLVVSDDNSEANSSH